MTSWRPPGSILEAPDSILEAPKLDLGRFWHDFFEILGQNAKKAKNAKNACQNKTAITNPPRVGGRRCSPPGGFQWNSSPGDLSFRKGRPQKYVRLKMCRPYFWWSKFRSAKKKCSPCSPKNTFKIFLLPKTICGRQIFWRKIVYRKHFRPKNFSDKIVVANTYFDQQNLRSKILWLKIFWSKKGSLSVSPMS